MVVIVIQTETGRAVPGRIGIVALGCMCCGLCIAGQQDIKGGKCQGLVIGCCRCRDQVILIMRDKAGFDFAAFKGRMTGNIAKETGIGGDPDDLNIIKGRCHTAQRRFAINIPGDQLGDHRVIMDRNFTAFIHAGIDAHMVGFTRHAHMHKLAGGRKEIVLRVFGIDANFKRMAVDRQFFLRLGQFFTIGNAKLPFHKIFAGDFFGHRMFDLKAGVHFHEIETARRIKKEFNRTGPLITNGLGGIDGGLTHLGAEFLAHARGRGFFDHFLVATLKRTVTFKQVNRVAMAVGKDLNFDMARFDNQLFNQAMVIAKAAGGFAFAADQGILEVGCLFNGAHALAATTGRCLDQNRITDFVGLGSQKIGVLIFAVIAGDKRHTGLVHDFLGFGFGAHCTDRTCRWSDKDATGCFKRVGKTGIFRQEPIARMNCIGT